jgi:hypothetical protein
MPTYTDSFTIHGAESAGAALSTHTATESGCTWTHLSAPVASLALAAPSYVVPIDTDWSISRCSVAQSDADSACEVDVVFPAGLAGTGQYFGAGLVSRLDGSGDGYAAFLGNNYPTAGKLRYSVYRVAAGTLGFEIGATSAGLDWVAGATYRIRLRHSGTAIHFDISTNGGGSWALVRSETDGAHADAGHFGLIGYRGDSVNPVRLTNFTANASLTPPSPPSRVRPGWPKVSPCRELIGFVLEDIAGTYAPFTSLSESPTCTVDGSPLTLDDRLSRTQVDHGNGSVNSSYITPILAYPVRPAAIRVIADDADASFAHAGTWTLDFADTDTTNDHEYCGTGFSFSNSDGATATWTLPGLVAGDYKLYGMWQDRTGGSRSTDARYVVKQDASTIMAAVSVDQGVPATHDEVGGGLRWQHIGDFAYTAGTCTVILANVANGGSYIMADAVMAVQQPGDTIAPGATVHLTAPDGWCVTASGDVAGLDLDVPLATAEEWNGYAASDPRTMKAGYNLGWNYNYEPNDLYANMWHNTSRWFNVGIDADGNPTDSLATAEVQVRQVLASSSGNYADGTDWWGLATWAPGHYELTFTLGPDGLPTVLQFYDNKVAMSNAVGPTLVSGTRYKFTCDLAVVQPQRSHAILLNFRANKAILDPYLRNTDEVPDGWDKLSHPFLYNFLHGKCSVLRFMDLLLTNNSGCVDFSDFQIGSAITNTEARGPITCAVTAVGPVDVTVADADGARVRPGSFAGKAAIKVTATAHGFKTGQLVTASGGAAGTWADTGGGNTTTTNQRMVLNVVDANHFVLTAPTTTTSPYDFSAHVEPVTLSTTHSVSGHDHQRRGTRAGPDPAPTPRPRFANEVGSDGWINIPHALTDAASAAMADVILDMTTGITPGRQIVVEYTNEPWNYGFGQYNYLTQESRAAGISEGAVVGPVLRPPRVAAPRDLARAGRRQGARPRRRDPVLRLHAVQRGGVQLATTTSSRPPWTTASRSTRWAARRTRRTCPRRSRTGTARPPTPPTTASPPPAWSRSAGSPASTPAAPATSPPSAPGLDDAGFTAAKLMVYEGSPQTLCAGGSDAQLKLDKATAARHHPSLPRRPPRRAVLPPGRPRTSTRWSISSTRHPIMSGPARVGPSGTAATRCRGPATAPTGCTTTC